MKVKFMPSGEEHEIEFNETILHLAQRKDIHIQSVCKGIPSCAECRVRILDGEHHVLPPSSKEVSLIGTAHYVDLSRLSCQLRCFGDVTVDLTEQIEKEELMKKRSAERMRSDGEESRAVVGGVFDDASDLQEELEKETSDGSKRRRPKKKALDVKKSFYGSFYDGKETGKKKSKSKKSKSKNSKKSGNSKNKKRGGRSRRRRSANKSSES